MGVGYAMRTILTYTMHIYVYTRSHIHMASRMRTSTCTHSFTWPQACAHARRCHVLVASDAIGMGLNLSIQRVIFTTLSKFDGQLCAAQQVKLRHTEAHRGTHGGTQRHTGAH